LLHIFMMLGKSTRGSRLISPVATPLVTIRETSLPNPGGLRSVERESGPAFPRIGGTKRCRCDWLNCIRTFQRRMIHHSFFG
jgi:hypothetical protein